MKLHVSGISYHYPVSHRGLAQLDFQASSGGIYALTGESGCGKSTALACISGLLRPDQGSADIDGRPVRVTDCAILMQYVPLFSGLCVWENISLSQGGPKHFTRDQAVVELGRYHLDALADSLPSAVSLGERQRVALAATLLLHRPIVLIDEPTNNLDSENRALIVDQLRNARNENNIIIVATHDPDVVRMCDEEVSCDAAGGRA